MGGRKLQIYPTRSTYSTLVMGCEVLGCLAGVECEGLGGGFISVVSRWKTKKMTSFMPPLGNFHGGWRKVGSQ